MRVVINGESWGVYVNAQQFNKDFLRDNFSTEKGARWKVPGSPGGRGGMEYLGEDVADYKRIYEIKTKDDPKAWADLIRLCKVLNETPPESSRRRSRRCSTSTATLKFLALDVALVNSDGFWTRASDYSIYQDEKGRFHVIPHDMNEGARGRRRRLRRPWLCQAAGPDAARQPTRSWIPLVGLTIRARRCDPGCSPFRHSAPATWPTCTRSQRNGWIGRSSSRSCARGRR